MQTEQKAGSPSRLWCWLEGRHWEPLCPSQTDHVGAGTRRLATWGKVFPSPTVCPAPWDLPQSFCEAHGGEGRTVKLEKGGTTWGA